MTLADVFSNTSAVINDPLKEIHNPVVCIDEPPKMKEYADMLEHLNPDAYPSPKDLSTYNTVNPLHGIIKPCCIK